MPLYPHLMHPGCPECQSLRTIQTAREIDSEQLYCPECGHIWDRAIPTRARSASSPSAALGPQSLEAPRAATGQPPPYDLPLEPARSRRAVEAFLRQHESDPEALDLIEQADQVPE